MSFTAETFSQKAASAATHGGSAVAIFGGLNDWNAVATIGGIVIGVFGLALQWFYKHKHYKLAEKKLEAELED